MRRKWCIAALVACAMVVPSPAMSRTWTPHIGGSFDDVPRLDPFYRVAETLLHHDVSAGCSTTSFCPSAPVTRAQMAVMLLRTLEGPSYVPPACRTPVFADVPCSDPFARCVNELAARGITAGCGAGLYCPSSPVTRGQMSVFLSRTFGLELYGVADVR